MPLDCKQLEVLISPEQLNLRLEGIRGESGEVAQKLPVPPLMHPSSHPLVDFTIQIPCCQLSSSLQCSISRLDAYPPQLCYIITSEFIGVNMGYG